MPVSYLGSTNNGVYWEEKMNYKVDVKRAGAVNIRIKGVSNLGEEKVIV